MDGNTTYAEGSVLNASNSGAENPFAIVRVIDLYKFQAEYQCPILRKRFSQMRADARTNLWHLGTFDNLKPAYSNGALAVLEAGLAVRQAAHVDSLYPALARELVDYALGIHDATPSTEWLVGVSLIQTVLEENGIGRNDIRGVHMRKYDHFLHELAPTTSPRKLLEQPTKYLEMRVGGA